MGRKAGHLALGIGKAAGATLTLIPEEFSGGHVPLRTVVDTLAGAVIKRRSDGRRDGVAVIAEGLALRIRPADLQQLSDVERDEHGHVRIAEISLGDILKSQVNARLREFGPKSTIVAKNVGYELRCVDPVPMDMEYTRDLGYCAAQHLLEGGTASVVSLDAGQFVPVPFARLLAPEGRFRVRLVDTKSTRYRIAQRYMIRLGRDDFEDTDALAKLAATSGVTAETFRREFGYLVDAEQGALPLDERNVVETAAAMALSG